MSQDTDEHENPDDTRADGDESSMLDDVLQRVREERRRRAADPRDRRKGPQDDGDEAQGDYDPRD